MSDYDVLPDSYDVGGFIPSEFKLSEDKKSKINPLMEYEEEARVEESPQNIKDDIRLESDFDKARGNLANALETTSTILTDAIALAQASDSPRAYEVVATLLKSISDVNKDLLELHQQRENIRAKRQVKGGEVSAPGQVNQQNNFFVGSPSELNRMMNEVSQNKLK